MPTLPLNRRRSSSDDMIAQITARALARASEALTYPQMPFRQFLAESWPIIEPANPLQPEKYIDCLCEHLEAVTIGQIRKLLINMPPREAKSNVATVDWPAWSWTRKAFLRFITCSYSGSLSEKHASMRRNIIESNWYQRNWGGLVRLASDQNKKNEYENTARGHMIATSVGGTITGKGGDVIIEDDMINPTQAISDAERKAAIDMHKMVLSTRMDNPRTGSRVIVEQRTHDMDVSGHVLTNESGWLHLNLQLVATRQQVTVLPISKTIWTREIGDVLSPGRHGPVEIADLKKTMTPECFEAQCQQEPSSDVGNILKRTYWRKYTELPTAWDFVITSWDMSFKETKSGSYVVGQAWGKRGADFYLFPKMVRQRMDFSESLEAVKQLASIYRMATAHIVEDKANGPAVISSLQSRIPGLVPIAPYGSKPSRAQAVAPLIRAGNVYIPDESLAPWVLDYVEECAKFRGAASEINDQVDATTQALIYLHQTGVFVPDTDDENEDMFDVLQGVGQYA